MVCVKLPKSVLAIFHVLWSNEVAIFLGLKGHEPIKYFEFNNVSSWSSLSVARLDKAASYSACQSLTAHDARYASLKRNERAQSTNGLNPRASTGARRSKVDKVKLLVAR
jgi:hypothetical protein